MPITGKEMLGAVRDRLGLGAECLEFLIQERKALVSIDEGLPNDNYCKNRALCFYKELDGYMPMAANNLRMITQAIDLGELAIDFIRDSYAFVSSAGRWSPEIIRSYDRLRRRVDRDED